MAEVKFRDRIKSLKRVKASDLIPNPHNWRRHPESQLKALRSVIDDVGFVGAELAIETPDGLMLIDGHARAELSGDQKIPVLITDLDEEEAKALLVVFDPLTSMADVDEAALAGLLELVHGESEGMQELLEKVASINVPPPMEAPESFPEAGSDIDTEYKCPACHYQWSGGKS